MCVMFQRIGDVLPANRTPCLQGSVSVTTAMGIMDIYEIDIIGVECEDDFAGVFSRGDFNRSVIRQNLNPDETSLYEAMALNPPHVEVYQSVKETYEAMLAYQWEYMPVLEGNRLRGIVSMRDLGRDVMKSFEDVRNENELIMNYIHGGESYAIANYRN